MHEDVNWPRASTWLAGGASQGEVEVLGAPLNFSITPGHCDQAPTALRNALARFSTYDLDADVDLRDLSVVDRGDIWLDADVHLALDAIQAAVANVEAKAVLLGGDNGVTRPGVKGLAQALGVRLERIGLITIDAHLDLRDLDTGPINGNPVRGLLADGLPGHNIVQLGIQAFANSAAYMLVAREAGIQVVSRQDVPDGALARLLASSVDGLDVDAVYVDFDLDAMDRAFAPGCPGSRPGGFLPQDLRAAAFAAGRHPQVRMIDLVELDPTKDINDATALAGAACLLSFASGVLAAR